MSGAELAAQFARFAFQRAELVALRADLGRALDGDFLQSDNSARLPADFDLPPRGDLLDRAQALLQTKLIDRVLCAQRVALGDRLRFGQRGLQARPRLGEASRSARDRWRRRHRQQRGDQKSDSGKNRLLDQFRRRPKPKTAGIFA